MAIEVDACTKRLDGFYFESSRETGQLVVWGREKEQMQRWK